MLALRQHVVLEAPVRTVPVTHNPEVLQNLERSIDG